MKKQNNSKMFLTARIYWDIIYSLYKYSHTLHIIKMRKINFIPISRKMRKKIF